MLTTLAPCLKTANSLRRFCTPIRFCWSIRPAAGSEEKVKIYNTTVGFWRGLLWNPTDGVLSACSLALQMKCSLEVYCKNTPSLGLQNTIFVWWEEKALVLYFSKNLMLIHSGFKKFLITTPPQHRSLVPNYYCNIPLAIFVKLKPKIVIVKFTLQFFRPSSSKMVNYIE